MRLTLLALLLAFLSLPAFAADPAPVKVGAYYFDGWNPGDNHVTEGLRTTFANREPIWGWMDDKPEVMQQQIDLCANAGISYWSFCWYWPSAPHETVLNNALQLYLQAPNRSRLQFCLLVANHGGFYIGPKDWPEVTKRWIELFKQPTAVTVHGKPLIIFFEPKELRDAFGGDAGLKAAFDKFQADAKAAGLPGVSIGCCTLPGPRNGWLDLGQLRDDGFEVFTEYNIPGYTGPDRPKQPGREQVFADMIHGHEAIWNYFAESKVGSYIPIVTTGWDRRPWEGKYVKPESHEIYYADRTPALVQDFVQRAIAWVRANPDEATPDKMIMLDAWNENGEGGYLTPTKAEGSTYLDAVTAAMKGP